MEVSALAPDGTDDGAALGLVADAPATALRSLIGSDANGADDVVRTLAALGIRPPEARAGEAVRRMVTAGLPGDVPGRTRRGLRRRAAARAIRDPGGTPSPT